MICLRKGTRGLLSSRLKKLHPALYNLHLGISPNHPRDFIEDRIDLVFPVSNACDSQNRLLPQFIVSHFSDRDVKFLVNPVLKTLQNPPLIFEGTVRREKQLNGTDTHNH